jgi:hypothetical protein
MPRRRGRRSPPRNRSGQFTSRRRSRGRSRSRSRARSSRSTPRTRRASSKVGLRLFGRGEMAAGAYPRPARTFHEGSGFRFPSVSLSVSRDPYARGKNQAFQVCATQGKATKCANGRNPRVAAAAALRSIAGSLSARRGAFAALSGYGRRRKRRRR